MAIPARIVSVDVPAWILPGQIVVITASLDNTSDVTQYLGLRAKWQISGQWYNTSTNLDPVPFAGVSQVRLTFQMPDAVIYVGLNALWLNPDTFEVAEGDPQGPYRIDITEPAPEPTPAPVPELPPIDSGPWFIPVFIRDLINAIPGGSLLLWPSDLLVGIVNYLAPALQEARAATDTVGDLASEAITKLRDWLNQSDPWFNVKVSDWWTATGTIWLAHIRAEREDSQRPIWQQIGDLALQISGLDFLVKDLPRDIAETFAALPNTEPFKSTIGYAVTAYNIAVKIPDVVFSLPEWFPRFITDPIGFALDQLDAWLNEEVSPP